MVTPQAEDYLKAIYRLQAGETRAAPSEIAAAVGVKPPTVTKTLQRLDEDGLVSYERYQGAVLTDRGERRALEVLRNHRLLELFLTEHLGYDWAAVHAEADVLEHYISEELESRIAALLDYPTVDPHGEPIPTAELELPQSQNRQSLARCREGAHGVVAEVRERSRDVLTYLGDAGVTLGTVLEVREVAPFGMVTVEVTETGERLSLPGDVAETVYLSGVDDAAAGGFGQFREVY